MIRTLPADAAAIVRAYPPLVVCFAAALALTALVFDVFYLVASPGLTLAAVYTIPVLAGLIAGLVAAADDVELERRVLVRTIVATVAVGITNMMVVAMVSAMRRTGPSDWADGGRAVLFAGCTVLSVAITIVVIGKLIRSLRLDLKTKLPKKKKKKKKAYVPPAVLARPKPRVSKQAARVKPVQVEAEPEYDEVALGRRMEPVPALTPPAYVPPPPKRLDLDGARPVVPWAEGTGLADRRAARSARRIPAVPPARRPHRHGRRGER